MLVGKDLPISRFSSGSLSCVPCAVSTATVKRRRFHRNKMMAALFNSLSFIFPLSLILSFWINILQTTFPFYLLFSFSVFVEKITWKCFPVVTLSSPVVKIWAEKKQTLARVDEFISFKVQEKLKFIDLVCAKFVSVHKNSVCQWHQTRQELHLHLKELAL